MNRYLLRIYIIAIAASGLFQSCDFLNIGDIVTNEVLINDTINIIEINSMMDVTLVQDTINKALVTCGENQQSDIDIFLKKKILHINGSIKNSWTHDYERVKLELHLISLPQLNIRKPVSITTIDTFKTNELFIIDWGKYTNLNATIDANSCTIAVSADNFGHFTIKGKSVKAVFNGWGSAFIYAQHLKTQDCTVNQRSIGDIYVNVQYNLNVSIETSGNVFYYGNPTIIKGNLFSSKKLIHLGDK